MGFADRLMRRAGTFMTPGANVISIDMATCDEVDPPGPTGVIVTDAELLLVSAGPDAGLVTKVSSDQVIGVDQPEDGRVEIEIADPETGRTRVLGLDFRYFGEQDDTVAKLLREFGTADARG
jgi:hypothetical protein